MKKLIIATVILFSIQLKIVAQAPQQINYQGVARQANGNPIVNQNISLRLSIRQATANGAVLYTETHALTTNVFGLYTTAIGSGTAVSGTFTSINWASGLKFLEVEIDPAGGSNYLAMGTTQFNSVPYALFAQNADNAVNAQTATNAWSKTGNSGTNSSINYIGTTDNAGLVIRTNDTSRIFIKNTGSIGIGTNTPTSKLEVAVSGNDGITINGNNAGDAQLIIENGGGNHYLLDDDSDGHNLKLQSANGFAINTGGINQRLAMDNTGRTSLNRATVAGASQLYVQSSNLWNLYSNNDLGNSSATYGIEAVADGTGTGNRYGVRGEAGGSTGNRYGVYGSATANTGSWAGYLNGNFYYTGSLTSTSDSSLKRNIKDLEGSLYKVMQLKPRSYEFRTDEYNYINLAQGKQLGFIAQEVKKVFPELVDEASHSFRVSEKNSKFGDTACLEKKMNIMSMNYISLVPVLTQAIQEQQAIIDSTNLLLNVQNTNNQAQQQLLNQQTQTIQSQQQLIIQLNAKMQQLEAELAEIKLLLKKG